MSSSDDQSDNDSDYDNPRVIELNEDGSNEQEVLSNLMEICKSYNFTGSVLAVSDMYILKRLNLRLSRELQLIIDENEALAKENEELQFDNQKCQISLRSEGYFRGKLSECTKQNEQALLQLNQHQNQIGENLNFLETQRTIQEAKYQELNGKCEFIVGFLDKKVKNLEQQEYTWKLKISECESKVEQFLIANEIAQEQCTLAQRAEAEKTTEIEQLQKQIASLKEEYEYFAKDMSESNEKLSEKIAELSEANVELNLKLDSSDEELTELTGKINEQNLIITYQKTVTQSLSELKSTLESQIAKLKAEVEVQKQECELMNVDRSEHDKQLKAELEKVKRQHTELLEQNELLTESLIQKTTENDCQLNLVDELQKQLDQCKSEITDSDAKHSQVVLALNALISASEASLVEIQKKLDENTAELEAEKLKLNENAHRFEEQANNKDLEIAESKEKLNHLEKELEVAQQRFEEQAKSKDREIEESKEKLQHLAKELEAAQLFKEQIKSKDQEIEEKKEKLQILEKELEAAHKSKDQEISEKEAKIKHLEKELENERDFTHDIHIPETDSQVGERSFMRKMSPRKLTLSPTLSITSTLSELSDLTDFESMDGQSNVEPPSKKIKSSFHSVLFTRENQLVDHISKVRVQSKKKKRAASKSPKSSLGSSYDGSSELGSNLMESPKSSTYNFPKKN